MLDSSNKMWQVQQPGTILRARHSARRTDSWLWSLREPMPVPDQPTAILPDAVCEDAVALKWRAV
jgi:hypothetical protein